MKLGKEKHRSRKRKAARSAKPAAKKKKVIKFCASEVLRMKNLRMSMIIFLRMNFIFCVKTRKFYYQKWKKYYFVREEFAHVFSFWYESTQNQHSSKNAVFDGKFRFLSEFWNIKPRQICQHEIG